MSKIKSVFSIVAVFVLIAGAHAQGPNETGTVKPITVDLLHEREFTHTVVIDDEREMVYFERADARSSRSRGFPYANIYPIIAALKKIHVAPMAGGEAKPLFRQEADTGYYFASADPLSPGGRYLAVYRLRGDVAEPGVYDLHRSRVRFFDIAAVYRNIAPHMIWISDEEFMFFPQPEIASPDVDVQATRDLTVAREKGWRGGEVTADVLGAGKYERPASLQTEVVMAMNVRTGKVRELISGYDVSPMVLVGHSEQAVMSEMVLETDPSNENAEAGHRRILSTLNLSTGEKTRVDGFDAERETPKAWSASRKYLLIGHASYYRDQPHKRDRPHGKQAFILDVETSTIVERLPVGASSFVWVGDNLLYTPGENGASGAERVEQNSIAIPVSGPPLITASGSSYYYMENGDLWRGALSGIKENLTPDYPNDIQLYPQQARHGGISGIRRSNWSLTPAPREIQFETEIGGRRTLIMLAADAEEIRQIPFPQPNSRAYAATPNGAVFLTNAYGVGSSLEYVPAGGEPHLVDRFNQHLADVTSAVGPIRIDHKGYDGRDAIGWLYLPPGASVEEPVPYPLVVVPYPERIYDDQQPTRDFGSAASIWDLPLISTTTMEMYAAKGYAVLLPSVPLGPWGEPGEPMTRMMPAVMSAVDGAIETGFADPDRMALVGHSFGGYGALSVAVQTDRFRAVIALAPFSNMISMYGEFVPRVRANMDQFESWTVSSLIEERQGRMGAPPWGDPDRYIRNSPLFHVDKASTPVMLIHGDLDTATFLTQSEEMFTGFYKEDKDALLVKYIGEHHSIYQTQNQRDMWRRVFDFLEDNGVAPDPKTVQ